MNLDVMAGLVREGLWLALLSSLPVLGVSLLVGFGSAVFQALTQIHDSALSHVPKLLAVVAVLALFGVPLGEQLLEYTRALWARIPELAAIR